MTDMTVVAGDETWRADSYVAAQFTRSAISEDRAAQPLPTFEEWWEERRRAALFSVEEVPFDDLDGWKSESGSDNLVHKSGRFFTVQGVRVESEDRGVWSQPIINQAEIGILGLLVKEFGGVPHFLVQAKIEPGNVNTLQLSPSVQATRSNYTRVHGGADTRYLRYFRGGGGGRVLVDSLQSEQGAWFWHKRNRNMVVRVTEDVPLHEDYRWVTAQQLRQLLGVENLVNMDTRAVLACMRFAAPPQNLPAHGDPYLRALCRSYDPVNGTALHTDSEILSWHTEMRTRCDWHTDLVPLAEVRNWRRSGSAIEDEEGRRFKVIGVRVRTGNREINQWSQPLIAPRGTALAAFLTTSLHGVLHVLVRARPEPGVLDTVELGPTVRCASDTDVAEDEPFYAEVAAADARRVRFDTVLSEEGGRFYHAQTRYQVIEAPDGFPTEVPDDFCWVTVHQLMALLKHRHYVNIEARSLLACLHSLW
ncbi:NDP-hexose 2,3-dehydratase family protein [Streptomyces sp. NPDC046976]|uniref:NDP-hexose 2,3-dehydratase family protein n=1 Tax=Streptomyces sp. NPDC046976 TaxID=3155258 RepID=UPI0033FA5321